MKAVQIVEPGRIQLVDRPEPNLASDQVLLSVNRIGYCGSDLAAFRGINPLVTYPRIPGHEIGATIVEIGADVGPSLEVGQRVLVIPYSNCGECPACRLQRPNCCQKNQTLGVQRDGALCEYFTTSPDKLLSSAQLSLAELTLVEPLSVGFHAVARGCVERNQTVAVFGCGAIGLGAIAAAHFRGARVIAIDIDDRKLAIGRTCGADETINSPSGDLRTQLQALTDGVGPQVMIEAVGSDACYRAAVEEVSAAGRVVYIGWAKEPVTYNTTPFVFKELDIYGSRNALRSDFLEVISMLAEGWFPSDELITLTTSIGGAPRAMIDWAREPQRFTKIHIEL